LVDELNLDDFVDADKRGEIGSAHYKLIGMVIRPGAGETGHYWANVRRCEHWFRCDDANVAPIERNEALRDDACVLFFTRSGFVQ
jgi:ubiquitin C-terminal hydrolase